MTLQPVQFGITTYQSRALPWSAQRLINWFPATAPQPIQAKTPVVLLPRPGYGGPFSTGAAGVVRGWQIMRGVLYAVIGTTLYAVTSSGVLVTLGIIPGTIPVVMDCSDRQICIVSEPNAYVYDNISNVFTPITDPDFPGASSVSFLDGFFIFTIPDTGEFFVSNVDDATMFDALDFATAESDGDNNVRGISDHREFYIFGEKSIEVWRVSGNIDLPLSRQIEVSIERGLIGKQAVTAFDNALVWVGEDKIVYRLNGYTPQRISQDGIDRIIQDTPDPTDIIATTYSQDGHAFAGFRSESGQWSIWYDAATQLWHERATYDDAENLPWDIGYTINAYTKTFGGSISTPNIYELLPTIYSDNGTEIVRQSDSPPQSFGIVPFTTHMLRADFTVGVGLITGQGSNPQAMLTVSDDGGRTFGFELWESIGEIGAYKTFVNFWQLGQSRNGERIYRIRTSDPVFSSLMSPGWADIELDDA